ncbi:6246_t:CDS:10 [Ambispora gerdemannii]|uniref:6246_t:CDS:1 n=1 Tax=Ambispora gerdemannii TaxID=144530 RepID=A0A9N8VFZ8_9GLOM|nr:6246_t:CDS:10 [Ambispora gerdemannii]
MSNQGKNRKRKWDLDDQGKEAPPSKTDTSPPVSKQAKLEKSSDVTGSGGVSPTPSNSDSVDPNIAAAVAAAKLKAMLAAKGIQVPVKTPATGVKLPAQTLVKADTTTTDNSNNIEENKQIQSAIKEADMDFIKDITINDCKNRYLLTKGATQQQIQKETGADVTTRGKYYPDKSLATDKDPPLFLHVTAPTQEALDQAVKKIEELMEQAFTPAPTTPTARPGPTTHTGTRHFVQDKVFVGIEPDRTFNARAKIVGPQGAFVKHIQQETGAKVQLKGRGSGYIEPTSGTEAFEPLHIHITCWSQEGLDRAKELCQSLINFVKIEWEKHKVQQAAYPSYGRSPYPRPPVYGPPPPQGGAYPLPPTNPPLPSGPPPPISGPPSSNGITSYNPSGTNTAYSANTNTAYNPYNPYNQTRYYQYPQYTSGYYPQTSASTNMNATDPSYYYGYAESYDTEVGY